MDYSYPFIPVPKERKSSRKKIKGLFLLLGLNIGIIAIVLSLSSIVNPTIFHALAPILRGNSDETLVAKAPQAQDKTVLAAAATPTPTTAGPPPPTNTPLPTATPKPTATPTPTPTPIPTWSLSGNVYTDTNINKSQDAAEQGYGGGTSVTVSGPSPASTTTDANGNYTFPSLKQGNYSITITNPNGYKSTTTNPATVTLTSNQTLKFGVAQVYTVTGNVFLDNNRNTANDAGDGDYSGATISFSGPQTATAKSDADGNYSASLFAGIYTVSTTFPANYQPTTPTSASVTLGPNQVVNFGTVPIFTITGRIFEDTDEDGKNNGSGKGNSGTKIDSVTVTLSGGASATTTTSSDGTYTFANLYAGTYTVSYSLPAKTKGTNTATQTIIFDSPIAAGASGGVTPVKQNVDFGIVAQYSIGGKIFIDANKNGLLDPGEPFYQGGVVTLTKGTTSITATSDASGSYSFPDRSAGDLTIAFDTPTGYRSTNLNSINFTLNTDKLVNFGIVQSTTTKVGGSCSENGVDIVVLFDHSGSMDQSDPLAGTSKLISAKNAASNFVDIISGHIPNALIGVVQFSGSEGFPNNPASSGVLTQLSNNFAQVKSLINGMSLGSGTCFECGIVLANNVLNNSNRGAQKVIIFMTDGVANEVTTGPTDPASAENIALTQVINGVNSQNIIYQTIGIGQGAVDFNPAFLQQLADTNGGKFYNTTDNGTLQAIYQSIAQDIGTGTVRGTVFNDKNINKVFDTGDFPLSNWTIDAMAPGFAAPIKTTTDAEGKYAFTGLCSKDFTFTQELQPGWYQTTDTDSYAINVESGSIYENIDFGNSSGFNISGNIVNDFDKDLNFAAPDTLHIDNATILFVGATSKVVSTTTGTYNSGALPAGSYTVSLISPLTSGYRMTYPLNGPPPSFQINIGAECSPNGAIGASCQ